MSGERLLELVAVMDRLRSPGGCPWDAKQTHRTLVEYLIEEAYETVEAIETDDATLLREELGDLLLQVVFHARIAQESSTDGFDIDDVAEGIVTKLIRRHPHVFADTAITSDAELEAMWHEMKTAEKGRTSVTDGIPASLPALVAAAKLQARSKHVVGAQGEPMPAVSELSSETELGRMLWDIVRVARARGWDAEAALRQEIRSQRDEIRAAEQGSPDS